MWDVCRWRDIEMFRQIIESLMMQTSKGASQKNRGTTSAGPGLKINILSASSVANVWNDCSVQRKICILPFFVILCWHYVLTSTSLSALSFAYQTDYVCCLPKDSHSESVWQPQSILGKAVESKWYGPIFLLRSIAYLNFAFYRIRK